MNPGDGEAKSEGRAPSVFDRVANAIAEAKEEADDVLASRPDLGVVVSLLKVWATAAVESGHFLRPDPSLGVLPIGPDLYRIMAENDVARPFIEPLIAQKGLEKSETASARLLEVLDCLISSELKPPAEHYLHRVAQLYLWGFDVETFALARSVLDSALQSKISDETVRRHLQAGKFVTLDERIRVAKMTNMISDASVRAANDIRRKGNDILHSAPDARSKIATPLDAIRTLRQVLEELYP